MIQLDYKSGLPIYDQLINNIVRLKSLGVLKANEPLPSVRQLATKLAINPNTVQRAYRMLEEKGIIYSVAGKGSFISEDKDSSAAIKQMALDNLANEIEKARSMGLDIDDISCLVNKIFKEETK